MHATAKSIQTWTIISLIEWGTQYLNDRGFEDSRLNVELLLAHILHLKRIGLYTSFDRPLNTSELAGFKEAFRRRLNHEPLQYIIGETEFMGIPFYVDQSVLIPRPETEELVQKALDWIGSLRGQRVDILDIGTGSCNIPIAIERHSQNTFITSIDVSSEALRVAAKNIDRNQCSRIVLRQQDVFDGTFPVEHYDMIISNPPYISAEEFISLQPEVKDFEPVIATTDNVDGLKFIREICRLASKSLRPGGVLFMEIAYNQGTEAQQIARDAGLADVEVFQDLGGNERMLQGRRDA